jgi:hypothetical protein
LAQPIKYAETAVPADRSVRELEELVFSYGGSRFEKLRDLGGNLTAVRFALRAEPWGEVPVLLEARAEVVLQILTDARPWNLRRGAKAAYESKLREQAYRIAWRQLRDFVEQALLAVRTGLLLPTDAFMWGLEVSDPATGARTTASDLFHRRAQLAPGGVLALPAARED